MHDFDANRVQHEREFRISGETFRVQRGVRPDVLAEWEETPSETYRDAMTRSDFIVREFLHPDDREKWAELRARLEDPVTDEDMGLLVRWLFSNEVERPTPPSSSSGPGEKNGEESSQAESSSQEATPTA